MTDKNPIGNRIATYRKNAGYEKASDLADAIPNPKITTSVIQNIESGRKADISVTQLLEISYALGLSPVFLLAPMSERMRPVGLPNVSDDISSMTADDFDRWVSMLPGAPLPRLDAERRWGWDTSSAVRLLRELVECVWEWDELGDRPEGDDAIRLFGDRGSVIFDEVENHDAQLEGILQRATIVFDRLEKHSSVDLTWVPAELIAEVRAYGESVAAEQDRILAEARRERALAESQPLPLAEMDEWLTKRVPRAGADGDD